MLGAMWSQKFSDSQNWLLFLLLNVGFSNSHPLNPRQHYFFRALDVDLCVECEAMREDE